MGSLLGCLWNDINNPIGFSWKGLTGKLTQTEPERCPFSKINAYRIARLKLLPYVDLLGQKFSETCMQSCTCLLNDVPFRKPVLSPGECECNCSSKSGGGLVE